MATGGELYSFNNRNILNDIIWPQKLVWHGAGPGGERQLDTYCDAWTSSEPADRGLGSPLLGGGSNGLVAQEKFSCQNRFVVLCIEATSQHNKSGRLKRSAEHFVSAEHYQSYIQSIV